MNEGVQDPGLYYFEVAIEPDLAPRSHFRVGWATEKADLQAPLGFDAHGWAYRDVSGSAVTQSKRNDAYGESFGSGDVVGASIAIPQDPNAPTIIRFGLNGQDQGIAFSLESSGTSQRNSFDFSGLCYYPAISIYHEGKCTIRLSKQDLQYLPPEHLPVPTQLVTTPTCKFE